jgi:alkanesulfonate monooxygenase SsuD/methylene tetrahydromethanopterin reductase-like flavin-dependent oxidoreductase (luciferase family)
MFLGIGSGEVARRDAHPGGPLQGQGPQAPHGEETTSDEDVKGAFIAASDPAEHVERIREIEQMGATVVVLQNNSGADPHGAIRVYGEQVLPHLRGARVAY